VTNLPIVKPLSPELPLCDFYAGRFFRDVREGGILSQKCQMGFFDLSMIRKRQD
jgi:hypothetical protein